MMFSRSCCSVVVLTASLYGTLVCSSARGPKDRQPIVVKTTSARVRMRRGRERMPGILREGRRPARLRRLLEGVGEGQEPRLAPGSGEERQADRQAVYEARGHG